MVYAIMRSHLTQFSVWLAARHPEVNISKFNEHNVTEAMIMEMHAPYAAPVLGMRVRDLIALIEQFKAGL